MRHLRILNTRDKKRILAALQEQFGVKRMPEYVFLMNNKNRLYLISRAIEKIDAESLRIDSIGLYFGEVCKDGIRLSIEGSQLVGPKAEKNLINLDREQFRQWLQGSEPEHADYVESFVIIKNGNDFAGSGKTKDGKLLNYIPKSRRLIVVND